MRCINATCDRPLTRDEAKAGHLKCRPCRRELSPPHPFNAGIQPRPTQAVSWWTGAPRDGFTGAARDRQQVTIASGRR